MIYSKTCVQRPLKIDKTKLLMTICGVMKVESIAECSSWSILQCFDLHKVIIGLENQFSWKLVLKTNVLSFLRVRVLHGFYCMYRYLCVNGSPNCMVLVHYKRQVA